MAAKIGATGQTGVPKKRVSAFWRALFVFMMLGSPVGIASGGSGSSRRTRASTMAHTRTSPTSGAWAGTSVWSRRSRVAVGPWRRPTERTVRRRPTIGACTWWDRSIPAIVRSPLAEVWPARANTAGAAW